MAYRGVAWRVCYRPKEATSHAMPKYVRVFKKKPQRPAVKEKKRTRKRMNGKTRKARQEYIKTTDFGMHKCMSPPCFFLFFVNLFSFLLFPTKSDSYLIRRASPFPNRAMHQILSCIPTATQSRRVASLSGYAHSRPAPACIDHGSRAFYVVGSICPPSSLTRWNGDIHLLMNNYWTARIFFFSLVSFFFFWAVSFRG